MSVALVVCTDLFFAVKIDDAARRAGIQTKFVKSPESLREAARAGAEIAILDLNCRDLDGIEAIRTLKEDPHTAAIPVTGFVSHVQTEVIRAARQAGCDRVLARSAFVKELAGIFSLPAQSNQ